MWSPFLPVFAATADVYTSLCLCNCRTCTTLTATWSRRLCIALLIVQKYSHWVIKFPTSFHSLQHQLDSVYMYSNWMLLSQHGPETLLGEGSLIYWHMICTSTLAVQIPVAVQVALHTMMCSLPIEIRVIIRIIRINKNWNKNDKTTAAVIAMYNEWVPPLRVVAVVTILASTLDLLADFLLCGRFIEVLPNFQVNIRNTKSATFAVIILFFRAKWQSMRPTATFFSLCCQLECIWWKWLTHAKRSNMMRKMFVMLD